MNAHNDQAKLERLKEALLAEMDELKRCELRREIALTEALLRFEKASPKD